MRYLPPARIKMHCEAIGGYGKILKTSLSQEDAARLQVNPALTQEAKINQALS